MGTPRAIPTTTPSTPNHDGAGFTNKDCGVDKNHSDQASVWYTMRSNGCSTLHRNGGRCLRWHDGTMARWHDGTMARWQKAFSLGGNASRSTAGLGKQKWRPGEQSSRGLGLVAACIVVTTALASVRRTISKGAYELSQASPMSSNPTTCFKKVKLSGQWGTFNASQCCCDKLKARQRHGRSASKQVGHSA